MGLSDVGGVERVGTVLWGKKKARGCLAFDDGDVKLVAVAAQHGAEWPCRLGE